MKKQDFRSALFARASVFACSVSAIVCGASAQAADVTYTYDALGRLKTADYSNGQQVDYSYDAAGNRTQVTANGPNTPPTTVNDAYNQQPSTSILRDVLANDSDAEGDTLSIASETGSFASISGSQIMVNAPAASGVYAFDYVASDGVANSAPATVTVTVPNVAPNAVNNSYSQAAGSTVDHNVLSNDTDANGDSLTLTNENQAYSSIVSNKLRVTAPSGVGAHVITYTVSDGNGGTDTATATINVGNNAPNAVNDSYSQTHGTTVDRNVLSNDTDANGDSLTLTGENQSYSSIVNNKLRVAAPNASGNYVITYTVSDGNGGTDTATATVNVPNVAPNAVNNTYTQTHGTTINHNVLGNDSDPNGDSLTLTGENRSYSSISSNKLRVVAPNTSGSYVITYTISDGKGGTDTATATVNVPNVAPNAVNNTYSQNAGTTVDHNVLGNDGDPNGDSLTLTNENRSYSSIVNNKLRVVAPSTAGSYVITYTVSDGKGGTDTATATVNVTVPNSPPNAVNDSYTMASNTSDLLNVRVNDTDPNGDPLTITSTNAGTITPGGTYIQYYATGQGFRSFDYTISDGNGGTDTATVTIYVQASGGGFDF